MSSKLTGDFGKCVTAFLLHKEYESEKPVIIRVGPENLPYDLIIPCPIPNSRFSKPTLITVKTRVEGSKPEVIPPTREGLSDLISRNRDFDFWISFVKYKYQDCQLSFQVFLLPAEALSDSDFGHRNQIRMDRVMEKAQLKFNV